MTRRPSRRTLLVAGAVVATPWLAIVAACLYLVAYTNLPQFLYARSIRNIYFDCMVFVADDYIYKMKPGECRQKNLEHDVVYTHDGNGFRNSGPVRAYDVAVLGDSHAHGVGVRDDETFSALLDSRYRLRAVNLAIGSYATMREIEVFRRYGMAARYVVIQYCSNDVAENAASLRLDKAAFRAEAEANWRHFISVYDRGKAMGYKKPLVDLASMLRDHAYTSKARWRASAKDRDMVREASLFAQILARYQRVLEDKRLIVLDVADYGLNSPNFRPAFDAELRRLGWVRFRLIDSSRVLTFDDYFFLDNHITPVGHKKVAAAIADAIRHWERVEPSLPSSEPGVPG